MSRLGVVVVLAGLTACASASKAPGTEPVTASADGAYTFTANLPSLQLRGRLRVIGAEVLLEPAAGTCQVMGSDSVAVHFSCSGSGRYENISLRVDRRRPSERSTWSASYRVQRTRQVCAEYGMISGQQVCVRTHTEYYDTTEGHRGRLSVRCAS